MKVQCCVCRRIRQGARWVYAAPGDIPKNSVSHGYCPPCAEDAQKQLRAVRSPSRA